MSDYMFMLESHLSSSQNQAVKQVIRAADQAHVNLFLTGGAMRDMLGGYPIRDLDFTVEGNALKLAKAVVGSEGGRITQVDEHRKKAELILPGGVTAEIAMARKERYRKVGGRPEVSPATIHEDLRRRDFAFNAVALSLNKASLGLLLDPTNGLADLEHREIRAVHNYVFYDDPARLLRLVRFKVRFSFRVEERTQQQYENARLEELERSIPPRRLFEELSQIALESNPAEVMQALEEEKLTSLFSPALEGVKLNLSGLARLHKVKQMLPFGVDIRMNDLALFLYLLTEKLTPKERAGLIKATVMHRSEVQLWQKLESRAKKLEREMRSAKLHKASQLYQVLCGAPGEEILFLYLRSSHRLVQDRIRNYLQKYLPAAQEITDRRVAAEGVEPGTPKFKKLKEEMIAARLDGRLKKTPPPAPEEVEPPAQERDPAARRKTHAVNRSPKSATRGRPRTATARP